MGHDESEQEEPGRDLVSAGSDGADLAEAETDPGLGILGVAGSTEVSTEPLGLIDRLQLARLRSRKELEAVEIVIDARLDEMRHAADASSRESKARWDARSAEVVSAMKTVVQAQLRAVENERLASRFESIERAYEMFAAKVREVETGPLPEELRADLIGKLREHLTATIARLESDAIADSYDLTD